MNAQNLDQKPTVRKNTKRKIKVDFERSPLMDRLKAKFLSLFFLKNVVWTLFRLVLLVGIAYIVLFPFFSKITSSVMAKEDFVDVTVRLIPKHFSLEFYKTIFIEQEYMKAFSSTLALSLSTALIQTFVCCLIAYGLAKFKFKGNKFVFLAVIFSLIIPHPTLQLSLYQNFRYFDILGIGALLNGQVIPALDIIPDNIIKAGESGINLTNSFWPMIILSMCGLAFKNGLYIFMLRQFFMGVPDELEESAYIDGSGIMRTFFTIILPISIPMMITVFLFAFSWQWTDDFYVKLFIPAGFSKGLVLMPDIIGVPETLVDSEFAGQNLYESAIRNTCGLMVIAPLIIMYLFCQKFLVQGIERSGLTAD